MDSYGLISLLPVIVVVALAFMTKRTLEPLLAGSVVAYIIIEKAGFFPAWLNAVSTVTGDNAWYILLFGFFGIFIALLEKSGGAMGFSDLGVKYSKTRGVSLIITWILGIVIFIDDYLNALGVGIAMRNVTDQHKVSREFLAYIVNSTGAAVCVLIPVSTWGIYMASQYEAIGVTANGTGLGAYIATVPYMFYPWVAVLIVPLFALNIIPKFGPMKLAETRSLETGKVFPDSYYEKLEDSELEVLAENSKKSNAINFILPLVVLVVVTIITEDILMAVLLGIVACFVMYIPQKLMNINEFFDYSLEGFKDMILVTGIVLAAFVLQSGNEILGLTPFIIEGVEPILSPVLLPALTFIVISFLAFATGSFWGIAAIAFPIIIPLAQIMDVNVFLAGGAIVSAAAFGSHTCFYGDAVTLSCASTEIQNLDYAKTSTPLILLPTIIAVVIFLIFGFIG